MPLSSSITANQFQSTLLMRGATVRSTLSLYNSKIFQSTLLMRGATLQLIQVDIIIEFQSTLLMRGATQKSAASSRRTGISIHAPHARSDIIK